MTTETGLGCNMLMWAEIDCFAIVGPNLKANIICFILVCTTGLYTVQVHLSHKNWGKCKRTPTQKKQSKRTYWTLFRVILWNTAHQTCRLKIFQIYWAIDCVLLIVHINQSYLFIFLCKSINLLNILIIIWICETHASLSILVISYFYPFFFGLYTHLGYVYLKFFWQKIIFLIKKYQFSYIWIIFKK